MHRIAEWIDRAISDHDNDEALNSIREEIVEMCNNFPAPGMPNSEI